MSHIGQNIRKIRQVKKISQAEFAKLFKLARPSVGAYEEGRSEPRIDTLIQIAKHFGLSVDILLTRELTVNDLFHLQSFKEKLDKVHKKGSEIALEKNLTQASIVSSDQHIEYIVHIDNKDYLRNLPRLSWPVTEKGNFRVFEVRGNEMEYHRHGIKNGDLVLGKLTEEIQVGKVYIIVTDSELLVRRLKKVAKTRYTFSADNPNYNDLVVNTSKINETWAVRGYFSSDTGTPLNIEEKVLKMEAQLKRISDKLSGN